MKLFALLPFAALPFAPALQATPEDQPRSLMMMECTAAHDDTDQIFHGRGLKFVGSHLAIKACKDWAESEDRDTSKCRIVSCEPVLGDSWDS
jgi:hypothetical protein